MEPSMSVPLLGASDSEGDGRAGCEDFSSTAVDHTRGKGKQEAKSSTISGNRERRRSLREEVKVKDDHWCWKVASVPLTICCPSSINRCVSTMGRTPIKSVMLVFLVVLIVSTVASLFDSDYELKIDNLRNVARKFQSRFGAEDEPGVASKWDELREGAEQYQVVPVAAKNVLRPPKGRNSNLPWTYVCQEGKCVRQMSDSPVKVSQEVCWLTCGRSGAMWPQPAEVSLSKTTAGFYYDNFLIRDIYGPTEYIRSLLSIAANITRHQLRMALSSDKFGKRQGKARTTDPDIPKYHAPENTMVEVMLRAEDASTIMQENTDESYELTVKSVTMGTGALITVKIKGHTYFGVRHGLESLSQLIAYDDFNACFQIVDDVRIRDGPAYTIRGIMIDTARNFMPVSSIYRVLDAMSYNKLNTLHWHLTDSNSFPFESKSVPQMSKYGAYDANEIYTKEDIQSLVAYAMIRGIQIIPELDAPAHAGNGWQWGRSEGLGDLAVCVGKEPWREYCGQPPCGQLNPMNNNVFDVLQKLYYDLLEAFTPSMFHMGGDEVLPRCWMEIQGVQEWMKSLKLSNHVEAWGYFQEIAHQRLLEANNGNHMKGIVWSSGLTGSPVGRAYLQPDNFLIQIWEGSSSPQIMDLLRNGYKVIFSNVDSMYLDMGGGTWLGSEHTYTYINWQKIYDNNLDHVVKRFFPHEPPRVLEKLMTQVLGGIAPLWSEKVNENSLEMKLWPRTAALAERLWTNPWNRTGLVYARLNQWNEKLKSKGVHTSVLQPQSCLQMTGNCDDPNFRI